MEFLISRWSIESHTFIVAWGEFCPTLEDAVVLIGLSLFGEARNIKLLEDNVEVAQDEEGRRKLEALTRGCQIPNPPITVHTPRG